MGESPVRVLGRDGQHWHLTDGRTDWLIRLHFDAASVSGASIRSRTNRTIGVGGRRGQQLLRTLCAHNGWPTARRHVGGGRLGVLPDIPPWGG